MKNIEHYLRIYDKVFTKILRKKNSNIYIVALLQPSIIKDGRVCGQKNIKGQGISIIDAFEDAIAKYPNKEYLESVKSNLM